MMSRSVATADEFLTSPAMDRPKLDVPVPELGEGKVIPIWGMTPRERSEFEDRQSRLSKDQRAKQKTQVRERILVECCRNDDGVKLFTSDQIEQLGKRRGDVVERLVNVALELSGFTAKDVEDIVKNSDAVPED
jgi:hypothetical protein